VCLPSPSDRVIVAIAFVAVILVVLVKGYDPATAIAVAYAVAVAYRKVAHRVLSVPAPAVGSRPEGRALPA